MVRFGRDKGHFGMVSDREYALVICNGVARDK